jgi:hypothetical protein
MQSWIPRSSLLPPEERPRMGAGSSLPAPVAIATATGEECNEHGLICHLFEFYFGDS